MIKLWKKGKEEMKKFYELKLKKSTDLKSFIFGILLTLIVVLPVALLVINILQLFVFNRILRIILLFICWALLMLCNGLSNLFTVKLAKFYYSENPNLTRLDEKAIFVYQTFSVGFGLFTLFIIFFFGVMR